MNKTLKLEVGKTYQSAKGERFAVYAQSGKLFLAELVINGKAKKGEVSSFHENGMFLDEESDFDLLKEI